jgi:hypothetical protein
MNGPSRFSIKILTFPSSHFLQTLIPTDDVASEGGAPAVDVQIAPGNAPANKLRSLSRMECLREVFY